MKTIYLALIAGILLTGSCKSKQDWVPDTTANTYRMDTTTITVRGSTWTKPSIGPILYFYSYIGCLSCSAIHFQFYTPPKTDGDYRIVSSATAGNEVSIGIMSGIVQSYLSAGSDGNAAHVSFTNGKLTIMGNNVVMKSIDTSAADIMLSFNLTEF